ncbi:mannose-6-phosphate isomerase-like protein (cupin superfamily) [Sphingomonas sp. SORGH_AS 950]|uniref:cupin domain-containing protein n=1 Tax=Sphingomonas sp. SORGH_AS_0950 TaxID=3041792 RepID=UPI002787A1FF|nr:cupin domain-containing protein [Sphingomonas sp. SORGH_AS_0950]MDQ1156171.1 mannose-6-phosphate isomerase-like protein (cupin superfamily) [Sphingomonas sp. SORGH_AS_0950]
MKIIEAATFTGHRPWAALDIAEIDGVSVRLHWTDQPYIWHVNDGAEVFVVLDGIVDMQVRERGEEHVHRLTPGTIFHAEPGDTHRAVPIGPARVLVVERAGSI